jgi:hypothetical protein
MGQTKIIVNGGALYDAKTGKLLKAGFLTHTEMEDYAMRHYMVLPETDKKGIPWNLDGQPVYCLHGARYETLDDQPLHLARCPDCGGMGIRADEFTVESDCIRCTQCGHEFDARLEMMES